MCVTGLVRVALVDPTPLQGSETKFTAKRIFTTMSKLPDYKILIIGPKESGKTMIANMLAEHDEAFGSPNVGPYKPTVATRILECERELSAKWDIDNVTIELWDVSGDHKYESCYPAIMDKCNGVILVYDPQNHAHESEVENWYREFVKTAGLRPEECMCYAYSRESASRSGKPPRALNGVKYVVCDYASQSKMRSEFDSFLSDLDSNKSRSEGKKS